MYYQVAKYIAAMNAVLRNEAEVIIFTGGIVYNDEAVDGIKRTAVGLKTLCHLPWWVRDGSFGDRCV